MEKCKGLFLRYRKSAYVDSDDGLVITERLYPLRRMSCKDPNCKSCIAKQWHEDTQMLGDDIRTIVYFRDTPKDGDIFQATLIWGEDEWEYVLSRKEKKL